MTRFERLVPAIQQSVLEMTDLMQRQKGEIRPSGSLGSGLLHYSTHSPVPFKNSLNSGLTTASIKADLLITYFVDLVTALDGKQFTREKGHF